MDLSSEGMQPFEHLVYCDMGVFISKIISYEERRLKENKLPKFGYLPKIAMASKGSIDIMISYLLSLCSILYLVSNVYVQYNYVSSYNDV